MNITVDPGSPEVDHSDALRAPHAVFGRAHARRLLQLLERDDDHAPPAADGMVELAQKFESGHHINAVPGRDLLQRSSAEVGFAIGYGEGEHRNDLNARATSAGGWEYEQYQ